MLNDFSHAYKIISLVRVIPLIGPFFTGLFGFNVLRMLRVVYVFKYKSFMTSYLVKYFSLVGYLSFYSLMMLSKSRRASFDHITNIFDIRKRRIMNSTLVHRHRDTFCKASEMFQVFSDFFSKKLTENFVSQFYLGKQLLQPLKVYKDISFHFFSFCMSS